MALEGPSASVEQFVVLQGFPASEAKLAHVAVVRAVAVIDLCML